MTRPCLRGAVVLRLLAVPILVTLTGTPATAQSRWEYTWPVVLGMAEKGLLVIAAPPAFEGCTLGETWEWYEDTFPNVYLFSYFGVLDDGAPTWSIRWVSVHSGAHKLLLDRGYPHPRVQAAERGSHLVSGEAVRLLRQPSLRGRRVGPSEHALP